MAHSLEIDEAPARGGAMLLELLRTMRPKEWIKNAFVFAAIAFAKDAAGDRPLWTYPDKLAVVVAAFVLFCMAAGAIYLINDLVDIEKDRAHPKKRSRPLASGRLSPAVARVATVVLLLVTLPGAFALDLWPGSGAQPDMDFGLALVSYALIQGLLYSYYLKNVVILDVFTIAAGFVLRAVAGAMVLDINITQWLLICMGLLALFLGFSKRRAELLLLREGAAGHRRILDEYSLPLIDQMTTIITAATIIAYILFTSTAPTLPHQPFSVMMITVPFVVYAIFRYLYLIHRHGMAGSGGSPADLVLKDMPLAVSIVLWGVSALVILAIY